ncbi:MAG: hypothetical protein QFB86_03835, partial [Patescibacteria group bacterium]|nr:hypothetical protein [Patescibacteria group bacterium]
MLEKFKTVSGKVASGAVKGATKASSRAAATVKARAGKQDDRYLVALDIGTEYVKALIGKVSEDGATVEIVGVGRAHQALSDMQAGAISDIAGVVENCD